MDKSEIRAKVKAAYNDARDYPQFLDRFKTNIQDVIDSFIPSEVTHAVHVFRDVEYLSEVSKSRGYKAKGFLNLVVNYVGMLIKAYENNEEEIEVKVQYDMFGENSDDKLKE